MTFEGCPAACENSQFGCCADGTTPARGFYSEGCPPACQSSHYGCCLDGETEAPGPDGKGCPAACVATVYGCCTDGETQARGFDNEGCSGRESETKNPQKLYSLNIISSIKHRFIVAS